MNLSRFLTLYYALRYANKELVIPRSNAKYLNQYKGITAMDKTENIISIAKKYSELVVCKKGSSLLLL